jgi:hypothetical protein
VLPTVLQAIRRTVVLRSARAVNREIHPRATLRVMRLLLLAAARLTVPVAIRPFPLEALTADPW